LQRTLAKVNYHIHTDAIKEKLIPSAVSKSQTGFLYASEADLLNTALFGITAKEWREANPDKEGNLRDHSTIEQLVVLSNLESLPVGRQALILSSFIKAWHKVNA